MQAKELAKELETKMIEVIGAEAMEQYNETGENDYLRYALRGFTGFTDGEQIDVTLTPYERPTAETMDGVVYDRDILSITELFDVPGHEVVYITITRESDGTEEVVQ